MDIEVKTEKVDDEQIILNGTDTSNAEATDTWQPISSLPSLLVVTFCSICKKNFCSKYFLRKHMAQKHQIIIEIEKCTTSVCTCKICGKRFCNRYYLKVSLDSLVNQLFVESSG